MLWAQKGKGVTPTAWSEAGCSWKIELLGGEPSEKAWGGCRETVVIDVHHADPLNLKRWNRAKSKGATLSLCNGGRDKAAVPKEQ